MILLSASKVWLWVQRDGGIWSFPTWTRSHLSLHRHPEMSLEVVEETLLILQESQYYSLLEVVDAVPRWMFSVPDLLLQIWFVHLRRGKWIFLFFFWEILLPSHWVFLSRFLMRPSLPTPQCLQPSCHPSKFHRRAESIQENNPGKTFFPNWWILDWSFAEIGYNSTNEPNGMIGPSNGSPKRLSFGVFPSDKRSWMFRR